MNTKIHSIYNRLNAEEQVEINYTKIQIRKTEKTGTNMTFSEIIFSDTFKKIIFRLGKRAERKITSFFDNYPNLSRQEFFTDVKIAQKTLPLIFGHEITRIVLEAVRDEIQNDFDYYTSESLEEIIKRIDNNTEIAQKWK